MTDRPTRRMGLAALVLLALVWCPPCLAQDDPDDDTNDRPNIVLIMSDDMGWGWMDMPVRLGETRGGADVMYPGQDAWSTPNLRAMAEGGLLFSRMYSQSAVCSPTRASCLTGRHPHRIGIPFANTGRLENREVTVAEYARALGYNTGMFGKWHLGVFSREVRDANRGGRNGAHSIYSTPLTQGFDVQYATESKTSTFDPGVSGLTTDTRYWTGPEAFIPLDSEELRGDDSAIIVRQANAFIRQAVENDRPFLAVVWLHTPHLPVNLPENAEVNTPAAFAFAMEDLDAAVGQVRDTLRELGVADDTLVCFTSDNGPENNYDYFDPLRGRKRDLFEGGVRVPGIIEWPGAVEPGVTHTPMVTTDYLPTILDIWGVEPIDDRPFDGQSMATTLFESREAPRTMPIYSNMRGRLLSIVDNDYKLISTNSGQSWELYDIVSDYDEDEPMATSAAIEDAYPEVQAIFGQLHEQFTAWQQSVEASLADGITGDYETRIESAEGITVRREPPPALQPGDVEGGTAVLYLEQQHATLSPAMQSSLSNRPMPLVVNSYLVHLAPEDGRAQAAIEITFEDEVAYIARQNELLALTDPLSFGDPAFTDQPGRGIDDGDRITVSDDRKTVRLELSAAGDDLDQVRILTLSPLDPAGQ